RPARYLVIGEWFVVRGPHGLGPEAGRKEEAKADNTLRTEGMGSEPYTTDNGQATVGALDRARAKAYLRLLPLLFLSYAIAYVDRVNVGLAKLKMTEDLPGFNNAVVGFGMGIF